MAHYGEDLGAIIPANEDIYKAFKEYFQNPVMVKIKDVEGHSMYMCKTYCLLSNECRYIIVFVYQDVFPKSTKEYLGNLKWISLQTRTLPNQHDLPSHNYQSRREGLLNQIIHRFNKNENSSTYKCDTLPLSITLLNRPNNNNDYQNKGNIIAAIETYSTIITMNN